MDQEGQQDHCGEQVGQELFAVSEVVVEMVALGLEGVVVLMEVAQAFLKTMAPRASVVTSSSQVAITASSVLRNGT
ncbi:MAG: hypothetical protein IPJ27_23715 [Candidatus Accumulibacter sp.]|uniref:Uncharacterized protein n=1 Tax=Candidatus Accumulibacter proximus TaxID=2954385 RepID=A0A935Q4N0_9PROT|nr:hypothetical protein [Candidatus Accumulibacter proximus]